MPRLMSFAKTVDALERGEKDVTRREGWLDLAPGDVFEAVDRSPRSHIGFRRLGLFRVVSVRRERLGDVTPREIGREGVLPQCTAAAARDSCMASVEVLEDPRYKWARVDVIDAFVRLYCAPRRPDPDRVVTRIEFRRLAPGEQA